LKSFRLFLPIFWTEIVVMMRRSQQVSPWVTPLTCALLIMGLSGCATFHSPFAKKIPKATAADPAVQILCLWQQAEGRDPEGYPCKGFAGQILFLSNRAATPVQIEGDVRIYMFDDQGTEEEQAKPLRQFDFDAGSWGVHLAETSLGPTYSIFVPYVRRGVKDANCALRVRLKPKQGPVIFSDLSNMPLNGNKKPVMGEDAKPISNDEADRMAADALAAKLHRTTTISMGSNPKVTDSLQKTKQELNAGQVTLASHEVLSPAPKATEDSDRIRQLEAMVQQLIEQKSSPAVNSAVNPAPVNPAIVNPAPVAPSTGRRNHLLGGEAMTPVELPRANRLKPLRPASSSSLTAAISDETGQADMNEVEDEVMDEYEEQPAPMKRNVRRHPLDD